MEPCLLKTWKLTSIPELGLDRQPRAGGAESFLIDTETPENADQRTRITHAVELNTNQGEIVQIIEPYAIRPVEYLKQVNLDGWRIKVYGIPARSEPLSESSVSESIRAVGSHLPQPASAEHRYGVGFMIVHQVKMGNWFSLDWWEHQNVLSHRLFSSPLDNPSLLTPEQDGFMIACVHELRIISFETEAWIKTVLRSDGEPSFDEYLRQHCDSSEGET